jgi:hypothetical protein
MLAARQNVGEELANSPGREVSSSIGGRRDPENYTWPLVCIALVIAPQVLIPARDRLGPQVIVPIIEGVVFLIMLTIAAKPGPVPRRARPTILVLFAALVLANTIAAVRLVTLVLGNGKVGDAAPSAGSLLVSGTLILLTNVVTFGLVYWELDGGGPAGRIAQPAPPRDFQFPQMVGRDPAESGGWQPRFGDHLYVAYTNIVAFSPTDTMPLSLRVKGLMTLQSLIGLGVAVVVVARVINILPT